MAVKMQHIEHVTWLGHRFLRISGEAAARGDAVDEAEALFGQLSAVLDAEGLGLDSLVRTRLWARSREGRDAASAVRRRVLSGAARSASSSYIAPANFAGDAEVALDAVVLSAPAGAQKTTVEHDPPRIPIRYLTIADLVVLSGVTAVLPTLGEQVEEDARRITGMLDEAKTSWTDVVEMRCYLEQHHGASELRTLLADAIPVSVPLVSIAPVHGYSAPGKLVEIEVTARRSGE